MFLDDTLSQSDFRSLVAAAHRHGWRVSEENEYEYWITPEYGGWSHGVKVLHNPRRNRRDRRPKRYGPRGTWRGPGFDSHGRRRNPRRLMHPRYRQASRSMYSKRDRCVSAIMRRPRSKRPANAWAVCTKAVEHGKHYSFANPSRRRKKQSKRRSRR